jgi:hypothetical protein
MVAEPWVEVASGVGVPRSAVTDGPGVQWNHIDGPMLHWAGHIDWLTWRERFAIWFGRATIDQIACKRWPRLARIRAALNTGETE